LGASCWGFPGVLVCFVAGRVRGGGVLVWVGVCVVVWLLGGVCVRVCFLCGVAVWWVVWCLGVGWVCGLLGLWGVGFAG
jgi:hypothetical protein